MLQYILTRESAGGNMFSKQEIRKEMLEKRRQLTSEEVETGGLQLLEKLQSGGYLKDVRTAFVYVSAKNEVSTLPLIAYLLSQNVRVCVPKTFGEGCMEACLISNLERDLTLGTYGILEPVTEEKVMIETIDLVIVPGVAFDKDGNRIGYGAGYYDRFLQRKELPRHVRKLGVCYAFQVVDAIVADNTDIPMDEVIEIA